MASATSATFSRQTSWGVGGSTSSQISAMLLASCGRPAGRAMNHQCRCAPPSPQRPMWTRPISPTDEHRALDAAEHDPLLAREVVREVGRAVVVSARLEDHDDRQAARLERP